MASNRRAASVAQPPVSLVSPTNWSPEEKRLVQQIDAVFKDVYRRWGRLGLSDFTVSLQQAFGRTVTTEDFESIFRQTAESLSVQFGTPDEVRGPALEVSDSRLFARVRELLIEIKNASGKVISTLRSNGAAFEVGTLNASNINCPTVLKWTDQYPFFTTQSKTVPGAVDELKRKIEELEQRVEALENPPEV